MSRIITMPTTPNFATSEFSLFRAVGNTISPFTGKVRTQEFDAVYWQLTAQLPLLNRSQAAEWQAFFTELKGSTNTFKVGDPDAKTNTGTYSDNNFTASRVIDTGGSNVSISISGSTLTRSGAFTNAYAGNYIHITGATNESNNGTHKIASKTSNNAVVLDTDFSPSLVDETFNGKIRQNTKGSVGIHLTRVGSGSGTVKKGDYLGVLQSASATAAPKQLLLVTDDADVSGTNYSIKTEPKLRNDLATGTYVNYGAPVGLFRLMDNTVLWSANRNSLYSMSFSAREVI
jgi:hypothetical protein